MKPGELKDFLTSLKETDIEELSIEIGEDKVFFKKSETAEMPQEVAAAEKIVVKKEETIVPMKSPMVGTFFHSQTSDHPPFVIEGNHIVPGQKLGIIEAMKIMKDVNSSLTGKIVKVSVKNGQAVEYGQELFLVDTGHDSEENSKK